MLIRAVPVPLLRQVAGLPSPTPYVPDAFVATDGGTGTGSIIDPWSFAHVLSGAGGGVVPGLRLGYRGGRYDKSAASSYTFTVAGTSSPGGRDDITNSIVHRPYNNEHVEWTNSSLTAAISVTQLNRSYNVYIGIDGWRDFTNRFVYPGPGNSWWVRDGTDGIKMIHCYGHEGSNGIFIDPLCGDFEGWNLRLFHAGSAQDPRAHGGYVHHTADSGKELRLTECMTFNHQGLCFQAYTSGGSDGGLEDIVVVGLVAFGGGIISTTGTGAGGPPQTNVLIGTDVGGHPVLGAIFREIMSHSPAAAGAAAMRFYNGGGGANNGQDALLRDSYLIGGLANSRGALHVEPWGSTSTLDVQNNDFIQANAVPVLSTDDAAGVSYPNWTWLNNRHAGQPAANTRWRSGGTNRTYANWKTTTGLGGSDTQQDGLPTAVRYFVRPTTKYGLPASGNVIIYNWPLDSSVLVDLSSILTPGMMYVVRNVQTPFGPPVLGPALYQGGAVSFPTAGVTPQQPVGKNDEGQTTWVNPPVNTGPFYNAFEVEHV